MSARPMIVVMAAALLGAVTPLPAQQTPPATRPAAPVSAAARAANQGGARPSVPARPGTAQAPVRDTTDSATATIDYRREVYSYQGAPRDPFASLMNEAASQATVADLRLVSVIYDARGGRSVAVVREKNNPRPHRLRRGDTLGRLRVIQIRPYEVVFQVEEFGFERQEVLALSRPEVNR
jgi:hypothetical protein